MPPPPAGAPSGITEAPLTPHTRAARPRRRHPWLLPPTAGWAGDATQLTATTIILVVFGLLMSFSASFVDAAVTGGDPFATFRRQLTWAAVGTPVFLLASSIRTARLRALTWPLLGVALAALAAVHTSLGLAEFGARRWLQLGPFTVQPSELAKLALVLWLAHILIRKRELGMDLATRTNHLLIPALPLLAAVSVLLLLEPDLGTALLAAFSVLLILYHEGLRWRWLTGGAAALAAAATVLVMTADYRLGRIRGWLHAEEFADTDGYQLTQSLFALGNGGLHGVGLGSGSAKWNYVPNPETDFLFAVVGEELGFIGAVTVLALFAHLLRVGLRISAGADDPFAKLVAFTFTGAIVGQALLNIATVTGLLPITGVTLPLLSVGGSSLVATLGALGIIAGVARTSSGQQG